MPTRVFLAVKLPPVATFGAAPVTRFVSEVETTPDGPCGPVAPFGPWGPWGPRAPVAPFWPCSFQAIREPFAQRRRLLAGLWTSCRVRLLPVMQPAIVPEPVMPPVAVSLGYLISLSAARRAACCIWAAISRCALPMTRQ